MKRVHQGGSYLIHVVSGEGDKDLIGPQVVEPAKVQARALSRGSEPTPAMVLLLEAARKAVSSSMRARVRALRERSGPVRVHAYPFVGRLGIGANAALVGRWLRREVGRRRVLFHCRGESAVEWAAAISSFFPGAGIAADIRGAWPEEALHAAGFDGPSSAPPKLVQRYHLQLSRLHAALAVAGSVLSVSPGMLDWLAGLGVGRDRLYYVPCGVSASQFNESVRKEVRERFGFDGKVVYAYAGILASYHSIEDGLLSFFHAVADRFQNAHLLCITTEPERLTSLLTARGIAQSRATVLRAPQTQVAALLSAADAGLLLMRKCRLAPTWQPIKYAEYLGSGLPVVISPGVGVLDAQVRDEGVGVVVDVFDSGNLDAVAERVHNAIQLDAQGMRERALALCEKNFLWSRHRDTWRRAYERTFEWSLACPEVPKLRFAN